LNLVEYGYRQVKYWP